MPEPQEAVVATEPGKCPHCGETDPGTYFDNPEDEFTYCYSCGKHATNPRHTPAAGPHGTGDSHTLN